MKKLLLCMVFALCAAASANAYAADATDVTFNDVTDTVTATDSDVKTVIITNQDPKEKIEDKNIYYMDQALQGSPLSAIAGFAMKKDPPVGTYYMTLRYSDDKTETKTFEVTNQVKSTDLAMTPLNGTTAFVTSNTVNLSDYKSIKVGFIKKDGKTTYLGCNFNEFGLSVLKLGDTDGAFVGVQLNGVDEYGSVSMWLSPDTLTKEGVANNE